MKATKFFATAVIVFVAAFGVKAQTAAASAAGTGLTLKTNDELVYHVNDHGTQYDLKVTIVTTDVPANFMWVKVSDPSQKGAVSIDNAGLADGMAIAKLFDVGSMDLKGKTALWASKKMYKMMKSGTAVEFTFDDGMKSGLLAGGSGGISSMAVDLNGTQTNLATITATETVDSTIPSTITVLDDAKNPLILSIYLNGGFKMELKSINQQ